MFPNTWQQITSETDNWFIRDRVHRIDRRLRVLSIAGSELSFFPEVRLLRCKVSKPEGENQYLYGLYYAGQLFALDFTNRPIFKFCDDYGVYWNAATAIDYLRFFFSFVKSRNGFFQVLSSPDDILIDETLCSPHMPNYKRENHGELHYYDIPPKERSAKLKSLIKAPQFLSGSHLREYTMRLPILFMDSIYSSVLRVYGAGRVEFIDEELLICGLPIKKPDSLSGYLYGYWS